MILEKDDNLRFVKRLCDWLDEKGMTEGYFFEMLGELGLTFPLRITEYTESEDNSFNFVCSTVSNNGEPIAYRIILSANESSPRFITFYDVHGFWSQSMLI